jgi:hypothetical protein
VFTIYLYPAPSLRISEAIDVLPVNAFMAWARTNLPFSSCLPSHYYLGIFVVLYRVFIFELALELALVLLSQ